MSLVTKRAMHRAALAAQNAGEPFVSAQRIVAALREPDSAVAPLATLETRPLEPLVRKILDPIIERHGHVAIAPADLLAALIREDPSLVQE